MMDPAPGKRFNLPWEFFEADKLSQPEGCLTVAYLRLIERLIPKVLNKETSSLIIEQYRIAYDIVGAALEAGHLPNPLDSIFERTHPHADYLTYVLACCCYGALWADPSDVWFNLIENLLERGADPMKLWSLPSWRLRVLVQDVPPFHLFLKTLWKNLVADSLGGLDLEYA
ncbi:hypothetical protein ABVK25_011992 [Lepraria finkii]|uniref:Uncharacterized protein n=1 Tax=Lepraria finkii TaxID=1340010 RepID=A0ABR4AMI2_9LECA